MPLRLVTLVAGVALAGGAMWASGSAADSSLEAADAVIAAKREKPNELGKHIDYDVEFHEGTNMAAFPSPDGQRMVISIQGQLWILPIRGGVAKKITPFSVECTQPAWSPDGRWIAFQNYSPEGNYAIWVVRPDGTGLQALTDGPFDDREPQWFPDSNTIVFASDRSNDKQYKIFTVTLGGQLKQITTGTGAESNPIVSPDGKTIAFVNNATIFTIPAGGGTPTSVGAGNFPTWTPDGSKFVYQSTAGNLNVNGSDVTAGEDLYPFPVTFMTNGRFIYTSAGKIRTRNAAGGDMQVVEFSATETYRRPVIKEKQDRKPLDDKAPRQVRGINMPMISPDGQSVAFVALNDLWVMKIGQSPVRLTNDTDRDVDPMWTKDGKSLYWSSDKGNAGSLAMDKIDLATKVRTRVATIPGVSIIQPTLSSSEDRIAYSVGTGNTEVMDLATKTRTALVPNVGSGPQVSRPFWDRRRDEDHGGRQRPVQFALPRGL
jgi:Tol biopolymer transport system component